VDVDGYFGVNNGEIRGRADQGFRVVGDVICEGSSIESRRGQGLQESFHLMMNFRNFDVTGMSFGCSASSYFTRKVGGRIEVAIS
jgi:hypothetical protein